MSHKFFKTNSNTSGLPSRTASSLWEKITKKAHDVWSVDDENGSPMVNRLRGETVNTREEPVHAHPEMDGGGQELSIGDLVLLFVGGKKLSARVASVSGHDATVEYADGSVTVPQSWLTKSADDQTDSKNMVADSLKKLLASRGGLIAIRISPSTMMSIAGSADGQVQARLFEVSTRQVHSGMYNSIDELVHEMHLVNYPEEIDANALLRTR